MGFDYDLYLQNQYEESCGEENEDESIDADDAPEEEDTEDVLDNMNRRMESFAISAGDL